MLLTSDVYVRTTPVTGGAVDGLIGFLSVILMFVVLWSIMIRPQMKCQKEAKTMLGTLAKGDEVITAGGVFGRVSEVAKQYVTVETATSTEITVQKNAMTAVPPRDALEAL